MANTPRALLADGFQAVGRPLATSTLSGLRRAVPAPVQTERPAPSRWVPPGQMLPKWPPR